MVIHCLQSWKWICTNSELSSHVASDWFIDISRRTETLPHNSSVVTENSVLTAAAAAGPRTWTGRCRHQRRDYLPVWLVFRPFPVHLAETPGQIIERSGGWAGVNYFAAHRSGDFQYIHSLFRSRTTTFRCAIAQAPNFSARPTPLSSSVPFTISPLRFHATQYLYLYHAILRTGILN